MATVFLIHRGEKKKVCSDYISTKHSNTHSCFVLERGGKSLISQHIPGDNTAGSDTEHTHIHTNTRRQMCSQGQRIQDNIVKNTRADFYLWSWIRLDCWAAPARTAIQTPRQLAPRAWEPNLPAQGPDHDTGFRSEHPQKPRKNQKKSHESLTSLMAVYALPSPTTM